MRSVLIVLLLVACASPPKVRREGREVRCSAVIVPAANGCDVALGLTTETYSPLGTMTSIGDGFMHLRCGESSLLEGCQTRLTCECDGGT